MKKDTYIKLVKLAPVEKPLYPTPEAKDFIPGQDNGDVSQPVEYTVTGKLLEDIVVGGHIQVLRDSRNGVKVAGLLQSSRITQIQIPSDTKYGVCPQPNPSAILVHTNNSIYGLTEIPSSK